ncbi:MAG: hypothetical protein WA906_07620, partial [Pacificimonas sp.]
MTQTFKSLAMATALSTLAIGGLTACGEATDVEDVDVAEAEILDGDDDFPRADGMADGELGLNDSVDLSNADDEELAELNAMDDVDVYDADGETLEVARMEQGPTYTARRAQTLTAEEQERRDAIDVTATETEARTEVKKMAAAKERLTDPRMDGGASFAQLDRNDDGKLSVAEFAIYDLSGVNPMMKGNKQDQTMPYVSTDAINMVAEQFARLDTTGDFFLNRQE